MTDSSDANSRPFHWLQLTAIVVAVGLIVGFGLVSWFGDTRINHRNYSRIQAGMSPAEVRNLFGSDPAFDFSELGLVAKFEGEGSYSINFAYSPEVLRKRGYQDCRRQQWHSPEVTVSVVYDDSGKVICRYKGGGQRTRFQRFWNTISSKFK